MSDTRWTPGPWQNDHGLRVYAETPAGFALIASTKHTDASSGDAALIAAAPDLYAALEKCKRVLSDLPSTNQGGTRTRAAYDAARAALAKARGEA